MKNIDLGWGHPWALLSELEGLYRPSVSFNLDLLKIRDLSYGENEGLNALIKKTHNLTEKLTGNKYKYIFITAGATQALNSLFKYYKLKGFSAAVTHKYGYPFYDDMIKNTGLDRRISKSIEFTRKRPGYFFLIDSPHNPTGELYSFRDPINRSLYIWDGVYHNPVYIKKGQKHLQPEHNVFVGSYGKLLGVCGARLGWVATNDEKLYNKLLNISVKDTATVSILSQKTVLNILENVDLDVFFMRGKNALDNNREEISKITNLFDGHPVPETGMFYLAPMSNKTKDILKKCNITFVELEDGIVRLSLGQTNVITKDAVDRIKKEDRIK